MSGGQVAARGLRQAQPDRALFAFQHPNTLIQNPTPLSLSLSKATRYQESQA